MIVATSIIPAIVFGIIGFSFHDASVVVRRDKMMWKSSAVECDPLYDDYDDDDMTVAISTSVEIESYRMKRDIQIPTEGDGNTDQTQEARTREQNQTTRSIEESQPTQSTIDLSQPITQVESPQNSAETPQNQMVNILEGLDEVHQMCTDILEETGMIMTELEELKQQHQPSTTISNSSISIT